MKPKIVIIDYGAGNLRSVSRAVVHVGFEPFVTADPHDLRDAHAVIVPGVGAAADTMRNLSEHGMVEPIREYIASGRPFLGVCMGQQALLSVSEEGGEHACLGIIPGRVRRLPGGQKVPHMGWNNVRQQSAHSDLRRASRTTATSTSSTATPRSRMTTPVVIGETEYGVTFASVLARDNVVATQFHPEKSAEVGLRMYTNFLSQVT